MLFVQPEGVGVRGLEPLSVVPAGEGEEEDGDEAEAERGRSPMTYCR